MRYEEIPIEKIILDMENPRIKQWLSIYKKVTSEDIAMALSGSADTGTGKYVALRESIKENKGIFTPIIVNHISSTNEHVVIEGNTRLKFYQEFREKDPSGTWDKIMCIVYDDMSDDEKHAIRLQAHMVGARDWDAYSKAKYLDYLYNTEKKSMEYLKVFCGGQEGYIRQLIQAYQDMTETYVKVQESGGERVDPRVFSYYVELQKNSAKEALISHGYDLDDFTKWVITEKIDRAEAVRKLARVLGEEDARKAFLKNNLTEGIRQLDTKDADLKKIEKTNMYSIIHEVVLRIRNIKFSEVEYLRDDPKFKSKREDLVDLEYELRHLLREIGEDIDE